MRRLGLERELVDATVYENTVVRFREAGIGLPTFAQLADPALIPANVRAALEDVGPDDAHPLNLFRVHWYNDAARHGLVSVPEHMVLPKSLTGVDARIVVAFGRPLPDDRRPQGAGCLRVPGAAGHHGTVRPHAPPRDLAIHGQLLPGRRRDLADHGLPRRCRAPGGHEPGALRLAGQLGRRPVRHHPDAGHREQRQGDLRQVR